VLAEAEMMVPQTKMRLEAALEDLRNYLVCWPLVTSLHVLMLLAVACRAITVQMSLIPRSNQQRWRCWNQWSRALSASHLNVSLVHSTPPGGSTRCLMYRA
jgi:hypothetical protein